MSSPILTPSQITFLEVLSQSVLARDFYLTGGTALAAYYIPYRLSEDLDFFSEKEVDPVGISTFLKSIKENIGYLTVDNTTSFNRNIFFLKFPRETLKVEFTYFPFPQIEKPSKKEGVFVDSVMDIAVNKLFTIYQKPRSRDFTDLYMIYKQYDFSFEELMKKARIKFDWHIDPLRLGSQILLAADLKDYPNFIEPLAEKEWQAFFIEQAKKLKSKIFSP